MQQFRVPHLPTFTTTVSIEVAGRHPHCIQPFALHCDRLQPVLQWGAFLSREGTTHGMKDERCVWFHSTKNWRKVSNIISSCIRADG